MSPTALVLLYLAIGLTLAAFYLTASRIRLLCADWYEYDPDCSAVVAVFIVATWPVSVPAITLFWILRGFLFLLDKAFPL